MLKCYRGGECPESKRKQQKRVKHGQVRHGFLKRRGAQLNHRKGNICIFYSENGTSGNQPINSGREEIQKSVCVCIPIQGFKRDHKELMFSPLCILQGTFEIQLAQENGRGRQGGCHLGKSEWLLQGDCLSTREFLSLSFCRSYLPLGQHYLQGRLHILPKWLLPWDTLQVYRMLYVQGTTKVISLAARLEHLNFCIKNGKLKN